MTSLTQLAGMLSEPAFISYLLVVVVVTLVFVFFLAPKWGNSNVFVYVLVSSLGGCTVIIVLFYFKALNTQPRIKFI